MREPLTRDRRRAPVSWAVAAILAASCTPALGAVGDVTTFPAKSPGNAVPRGGALGPDGALWYWAWYSSDPGALRTARRPVRGKRQMGVPVTFCCSRLIRVDAEGNVSARGGDTFGGRVITGVSAFAGSLWVASEDVFNTGPFRMWRSTADGFAGPFAMSYSGSSLMPGPDGNLWYAVGGGVGRMTRDGQSLTPYVTMSQPFIAPGLDVAWTGLATATLRRISADGGQVDFAAAAAPSHVAAAPDGAVWYSNPDDHLIGRLVPGGESRSVTLASTATPDRVAVTPDSTAWFANQTANVLYRVRPSLETETFSVPGAASLETPAVGVDGNVWIPYYSTGGEYHFARVLTGIVPASTTPPSISGAVKPGQVVTANPGQWRYAPTSYTYAWQRCGTADLDSCVVMPKATAATYTVTASDRGYGLRVLVTATNLNGTSVSAASSIATGRSGFAGLTVGRSSRRGYVISTPVTVRGAGVIRQAGTVSRRGRACAPRPVRTARAGTRVIRCTLSPRVRVMLATRPVKVTLATTFTPKVGARVTVTRRVTVPRITAG